MRRPIALTLLAVAAAALAALSAGTASAATPCWQVLINDWYDGRIDRVYPVQCYREALIHMPEDVAQYSTLRDDINRALQAAIAAQGGSGGSTGSGSSGSGSSGGSTASPPPAQSSTFYGGPKAVRATGVVVTAGRQEDGGPVGAAISSLGSDSADSVPIPLIVLGSLAIVLLALGSAGFVARRVQMRRTPVRPGAKS
jgi:hypothetical protein